MSWKEVLRIEIVGFLLPDNAGGLPDYFFVVALTVILVSAVIMK